MAIAGDDSWLGGAIDGIRPRDSYSLPCSSTFFITSFSQQQELRRIVERFTQCYVITGYDLYKVSHTDWEMELATISIMLPEPDAHHK